MTKNGKMDWTAVSIWNGSFRALWSTVLSIMIILCDMRYGFLINWFLSCKPLLPGIPHFSFFRNIFTWKFNTSYIWKVYRLLERALREYKKTKNSLDVELENDSLCFIETWFLTLNNLDS